MCAVRDMLMLVLLSSCLYQHSLKGYQLRRRPGTFNAPWEISSQVKAIRVILNHSLHQLLPLTDNSNRAFDDPLSFVYSRTCSSGVLSLVTGSEHSTRYFLHSDLSSPQLIGYSTPRSILCKLSNINISTRTGRTLAHPQGTPILCMSSTRIA
jgi:hypothetical protein